MSTQEFADFEINVDLTDTPIMTGEFSLLPIGTYKLVVKNVKNDKAKETGNPMVTVEFEVLEALSVRGVDPNDAEALAAFAGQKVWNRYVIIDKTMGRLKSLMVACGATLTGFRASEIMEAILIADIVHNQGKAQVGADGTPTAGGTFANVVNERPVDDAPAAPVTPPPVTAKKGAAAKAPAAPANGAGRRA